MDTKQQILITPLNWGLGHASRCIPIINKLLGEQKQVIIGSDGRALELLKEEFPQLPFIELPAYDISYTGKNMVWSIGKQLPKVAAAIRQEHRKISQIVAERKITQIISDNRFGCYHKDIESIFMTHQLFLLMPNRLLSIFANTANRHFVNKFDKIWVPDYAGNNNLSGKLSHGTAYDGVTYIGPQSRFQKLNIQKKYKAVIVLSGPEPQRTILEKKIIAQALSLSHKLLLVQGKTEEKKHRFLSDTLEVVSFLTSEELNKAMLSADLIISRSGYSTIMDLEKLGSKAVLVPTPGQTEQEYLADLFHKRGVHLCVKQKDFDLTTILSNLSRPAPEK